jgi:spermidine synthase
VKPWKVLERTRTADGTELILTRHTTEYAILADGRRLMSSLMHRSEEALAELGCERARTLSEPRVLVGGLGMGYTLRAALDVLPQTAIVLVAERVGAVVAWNRGPLGALAGHPLEDPRVRIEERDVAAVMRSNEGAFDAVLLDVDNGPIALSATSNAGLYEDPGIAVARASLRSGGVLAVWSVAENRRFERRLRAGGFAVRRERVRARSTKAGPRHIVLVAQVHQGSI